MPFCHSRLEYLRLRPPRRVIAHSPPPSWIGPGLTSTALSLLYRLFPPQYTYIHASPTRPSFPWLPLFRLPYSDESAPLYGSVPFISHTLSYACAGNVIHIHAVLTTHLCRRESATRRKGNAYRSVLLVRIITFFLSSITYLYRSGLHTDLEACYLYKSSYSN